MSFKNKHHSKESIEKIRTSLKNKHAFAREGFSIYKEFYDDEYEKEKPSYYSFLKLDNPLSQKFAQYHVSYQVTYSGESDDLSFAPKTFEVFGLKNQEQDIEKKTINMLINVETGKNTLLAPNSQLAIEKGAYVTIQPRGIEKVDEPKLSLSKQKEILQNNLIIEQLDTNIEIQNRKGKKGKIKLNTNYFI